MSRRPAAFTEADAVRLLKAGERVRPGGFRVRSDEAAAMLCLSRRAVQAMSLRGEIPGAAQIGTTWTYDPDKLQRFVEGRERDACRIGKIRISKNAAKRGGWSPPSKASESERAYEQAMSAWLVRGATKG